MATTDITLYLRGAISGAESTYDNDGLQYDTTIYDETPTAVRFRVHMRGGT